MLQKYYILLSAVMLAGNVSAQAPSLTSAIHNPDTGDIWIVKQGYESGSPPVYSNTGTGYVWDFSNKIIFNPAADTQYTFKTVASTPYANDFSTSSIAGYNKTFNNYIYYKTSGGNLSIDGEVLSGSIKINYSITNNERLFNYPVNFNYTNSDNFDCVYDDGNGYIWDRKGTVAVNADGWGTLKVGGNIFDSLLRVKWIETITDTSLNPPDDSITNITRTVYSWYEDSMKFPVFYVELVSVNGTALFPKILLNTKAVAGADELQKELPVFLLFPNPVIDFVRVDYNVTGQSSVQFNCINSAGQRLLEMTGVHPGTGNYSTVFDVSGYAEGTYILFVELNGTIRKIPFIVQ
ncbi:MAG: hypothetical protein HYY40_02660 [Bacteroidetes bacterium]|nr:hypothetical protein [Bacteroidota bacterium]